MLYAKQVWYIEGIKDSYIIQLGDGRLHTFLISPVRDITVEDLTPYIGETPTTPSIPIAISKLYGIKDYKELASDHISFRIKPTDKEKILTYCKSHNISVQKFAKLAMTNFFN
jgi:hypothetical protein